MVNLLQTFKQLKSQGVGGYFAIKYAEFAKIEKMQKEYKALADKAVSVIQEGKLLEIGPGPGYISIEIAKLLPKMEIIGLDISDTMIEIAKENANEQGLLKKIEFKKGDASNMPFEDSSFDFVISSGSLHHWKKPVNIFNEIYRVLKSDSKALICDLRKDAPKEKIKEWASIIDSKIMRWGCRHSFREGYTGQQIERIIRDSRFINSEIKEGEFDFDIWLRK